MHTLLIVSVEILYMNFISSVLCGNKVDLYLPMVINTWNFNEAASEAWKVLDINKGNALDAVEQGCSICERLQCDGSVGYGGSPDEYGETTLDAMIMDGTTHDVGAVASLRRVKSAISVARSVMEHTTHTLLVGDRATEFAESMGFITENLTTNFSRALHINWTKNNCQPNYRKNVTPDPKSFCGPYSPLKEINKMSKWLVALESDNFNADNHDTIGMVAIDISGNIAGGTSTNGAEYKVPGRVGDSPIPGSGVYVDRTVGGASATGDGDVMMRFSPALITVEGMRNGLSPGKAAEVALWRIASYYPKFMGAIVATTINGTFGAACYGLGEEFPYAVANPLIGGVKVLSIKCFDDL